MFKSQVAVETLTVRFLLSCMLLATQLRARAQESIAPIVDSQRQGEFDPFSAKFDHLYPDAMRHWSSRDEQLVRGLIEGETLRKQLLSTDAEGVSYCARICEAVAELQDRSVETLASHRSIVNFKMSTARLRTQLGGREELSADSFAAFDGRWFGRWGEDDVNHDWQPTKVFSTPKQYEASDLQVDALQYAWISNGFGWNYLVRPSKTSGERPSLPYVLGMVYYFDDTDFETIRGEKAHVGFVDSSTRLVWITAHEVFLEEVFPSDNPERTVYAITALYHNLLDPNPSIAERATQAVYTRSPLNRPAFFEFEWR